MKAFLRLPDVEALVEVVEMAELRLLSRPLSFASIERRLFSGEFGWLERTLSEPFASKLSLCGRPAGEAESPFFVHACREGMGGLLARFATSLNGRLRPFWARLL